MSVALFIVAERKVRGLSTDVNGKALGRSSHLDKLAKRAGVRPLMDFFSEDPDEAAEMAEELGQNGVRHRMLRCGKGNRATFEGTRNPACMDSFGEGGGMRLLAEVTAPDIRQRSGFVRMMIVTNPAQPWVEPGQGVLFTYADAEDGPCCCQWPLTDLAFAKQFIRRKFKVPARAWREVPDQLPGCMDDWLGPVRLTRASADAAPQWERHVGGQWVAFDGPEVAVVYPPT